MNSKEIENGILHIFNNDPHLAKIIESAGFCKLRPHKKYYQSFLYSIIGQQLSLYAAAAIRKRFIDYCGGNPSPEFILTAPFEELRALGLSNAKVKYVKDLAEKVISGEIHFKRLAKKSDEELIDEFSKVKGIGVWTVQMFLMFTLGRPDVLPASDLGLRKGIMLTYDLRKLPDEKKIFSLSKKFKWSPYCTIASWYLWRSLEI